MSHTEATAVPANQKNMTDLDYEVTATVWALWKFIGGQLLHRSKFPFGDIQMT